jgi:hypothetical protein
MAEMALKLVAQYLESKDTKASQVDDDVLRIGWNFEGSSIDIYFQFDESDTHVHLEGINFVTVPEDKYDRMYKVLNQVNNEYKLVKFTLDEENGQIIARDDAVIQLDSCGEECFELMIRMVQIVEDAYPTLMKGIWA